MYCIHFLENILFKGFLDRSAWATQIFVKMFVQFKLFHKTPTPTLRGHQCGRGVVTRNQKSSRAESLALHLQYINTSCAVEFIKCKHKVWEKRTPFVFFLGLYYKSLSEIFDRLHVLNHFINFVIFKVLCLLFPSRSHSIPLATILSLSRVDVAWHCKGIGSSTQKIWI